VHSLPTVSPDNREYTLVQRILFESPKGLAMKRGYGLRTPAHMQFQVLRTVMFLERNRTARVRKASRYFPKRNVIIGSYFPEQQRKVQNILGIKNFIAWNETLNKRKISDYYICYKNTKLFPLTEMCPVNNNGKINILSRLYLLFSSSLPFPQFFSREISG
jgi:hypothetical protein